MASLFWPKLAVHLAALSPALWLAADVWRDALGADPIATITHRSGDWALRFILIALAVTPLRRVSGWQVLARFRRVLGLYAFFYASLHFATYLVLDLGGYWAQILEDVVKRPYITVGFLAWLGMLPLALTSTQAAMRALGRPTRAFDLRGDPDAAAAAAYSCRNTSLGTPAASKTTCGAIAIRCVTRVLATGSRRSGPRPDDGAVVRRRRPCCQR
jgi:hypothetical protein